MSAVINSMNNLSAEEKRTLLADLLRKQAGKAKSAPLSFAQQRLWFLNQLDPDNSFYNVPRVIRLKGTLDVAALKLCLTEIVRRHKVLHTRFPIIEGQPVQLISPAQELPLPVTDLSHLPEATTVAER